jgi:thiol-disulfide isomerase/thioredoxin
MTSTRARSRGMPRRAQPVTTSKTPTLLIIGGIVLVLVLVGAVALALSGGGSSGTAEPATAAVRVQGTALPTYNKDAADPAVGQAVPTISGLGLDGTPMTIGPDDGALAIVVVAHWCPHCQAEIPVLSDWMAANELPDGIRVVTVSTGIDPARPNYPPSAWLEREGWTQPTLNDDASNSALAALGMASFPAFVFVNEDGTVAQRATGEIPIDQWEAALATITP